MLVLIFFFFVTRFVYYYRIKAEIKRKCENVKENDEGLITKVIKEGNKDEQAILGKLFVHFTGKELDAIVIVIQKNPRAAKLTFLILKYDQEYASKTSFVIVLQGQLVENTEVMKSLGSFIKSHPKLQNLVVGELESESAVSCYDNLTYVFEAISLSKTLKNFGAIRMLKTETNFKPETLVKITSSLGRCKLDSLGICNYSFGQEGKKKIYEGISKNPNLKLVGVQDLETKSTTDVESIVKYFAKSQSLKMLAIGATLDDKYEECQKKSETILRASSKIEGVLIGLVHLK